MTESEKIAYAKSFIDKLANGINPLDDTPIPENDIANHERLSRCFFYVSEILQREIERERSKEEKMLRLPFSITYDELKHFGYSKKLLSTTQLTKKINLLAGDLTAKNMSRLSYSQITKWLLDEGFLEWREWGRKHKRFPTAEGEAIGLVLVMWENYGRKNPVVCFSEATQRFVIDNIDAIIAVKVKRGTTSHPEELSEEESDE